MAAAVADFPTTKPLRSPAIRLLTHVPFNIRNRSSIRFWFSSFVNVEAKMEKHWRRRAAVSSIDCYCKKLGWDVPLFAFRAGRWKRWLLLEWWSGEGTFETRIERENDIVSISNEYFFADIDSQFWK
jgi:hypothetical protein